MSLNTHHAANVKKKKADALKLRKEKAAAEKTKKDMAAQKKAEKTKKDMAAQAKKAKVSPPSQSSDDFSSDEASAAEDGAQKQKGSLRTRSNARKGIPIKDPLYESNGELQNGTCWPPLPNLPPSPPSSLPSTRFVLTFNPRGLDLCIMCIPWGLRWVGSVALSCTNKPPVVCNPIITF